MKFSRPPRWMVWSFLLAVLVVALLATCWSEGRGYQSVRLTRGGYAACISLSAWERQHRVRKLSSRSEADDERTAWYREIRGLIAERTCYITSDSAEVRVHQTRHPDAVQVVPEEELAKKHSQGEEPLRWWLWREAIYR